MHAAPLPKRTAAGPPSPTTRPPTIGARARTRPAPMRRLAASSSSCVHVPELEARRLLVEGETNGGGSQGAPHPPNTGEIWRRRISSPPTATERPRDQCGPHPAPSRDTCRGPSRRGAHGHRQPRRCAPL
jgi:hypothetical protein